MLCTIADAAVPWQTTVCVYEMIAHHGYVTLCAREQFTVASSPRPSSPRSPLENHHAAAALTLMQQPGMDVWATFAKVWPLMI